MRTQANVISALVAAGYRAKVDQVQQLATVVASGNQAGGTYLKVVLATVQSRLRRGRKGNKTNMESLAKQDEVLEAVHAEFYPAVLAGVADDSVVSLTPAPSPVDDRERHRRASFARSAASTVRRAIRAGVDLRTVDAKTVSKNALARMGRAPEPTDRLQRTIQRAEETLARALQKMAATSPDAVEERLDAVLARLEAAATPETEDKPAEQAPATPQRRRSDEAPAVTSHRLERRQVPTEQHAH